MEGRGDPVLFSTASDSVSPRVGPRVNPAHHPTRAAKMESNAIEPVSKDGWRTAGEAEVVAFTRALSDPVRRAVLKLLYLWPMRQFELAEILSEATGRRCHDSLLYYHLRALERAGLIGFGTSINENRAKVVYLKVDYRVQFKPRPEPEQVERYARKRIVRELKKALGEEGKK